MSTPATHETESHTDPAADLRYLDKIVERLDEWGYWKTCDHEGDCGCVFKEPLRRAINAARRLTETRP
jgi:hypothetical protein